MVAAWEQRGFREEGGTMQLQNSKGPVPQPRKPVAGHAAGLQPHPHRPSLASAHHCLVARAVPARTKPASATAHPNPWSPLHSHVVWFALTSARQPASG